VLDQARRVLRPGGRLVIFDGDYVSLTYRHADAEAGRHMDWALTRSTFNNPTLIRDLPGLLGERGLTIENTLADIVTEVGASSYFRSMAETYAPLIPDSGLASREEVDSWLTTQRRAMDDGTFFASCNYYSYIARRDG
jgi:hypothetical protein